MSNYLKGNIATCSLLELPFLTQTFDETVSWKYISKIKQNAPGPYEPADLFLYEVKVNNSAHNAKLKKKKSTIFCRTMIQQKAIEAL